MNTHNPNPLVVLRTMWDDANKTRDAAETELAKILCEMLGIILGACRVTGPNILGQDITITPDHRRAKFLPNGAQLVLSGTRGDDIRQSPMLVSVAANFDANEMLTTKFTVEGT